MLKKYFFLLSLLGIFFFQGLSAKAHVSYIAPTIFDINGKVVRCRLGDQLLTYIKARWFAYATNLPFYFTPFEWSEYFALSREKSRENLFQNREMQLYRVIDANKIPKKSLNNALYLIDIYTLFNQSHSHNFLQAIRSDKKFMRLMRQLIAPRIPIKLVSIPENCLSVAVHIRKGGGYDFPLISEQIYRFDEIKKLPRQNLPPGVLEKNKMDYIDAKYPLKFPPEQYYVDQIKKIAMKNPNREIYIFLFTDDPDTEELATRLSREVHCENVVFDYRKTNPLDHNVIEDFFSMIQFDCLIRPGNSAFSSIIHFIGEHKIVVYPTKSTWYGKHLVMTEIKWVEG